MTETIDLKEQGLTETTPRLAVLKAMEANSNEHMSAEDIYRYLFEQDQAYPMSTVYRVLAQFEQAGIVERHSFDAERTKQVLHPKPTKRCPSLFRQKVRKRTGG